MASTIKADTLQSTTSNVFVLNSVGTEYARFDATGNMGIGTASPSVKLDVVGSVAISGAISGAVVATQANQETATITTTIVTPGRQQFHPRAAKAWIQCNNSGAIAGSYNVASIADTGTGVVTVTLTTAFSSTSYAVLGSGNGGGGGLFVGAGITNASVFTLVSFNTVSQVPQDSGIYLGVAFGDQ